MLAQVEHRIEAVREEETLDVKDLGTLHERSDRRRQEMRFFKQLGGAQRRHQRPRTNDPHINDCNSRTNETKSRTDGGP
jgi:hypothetical protein